RHRTLSVRSEEGLGGNWGRMLIHSSPCTIFILKCTRRGSTNKEYLDINQAATERQEIDEITMRRLVTKPPVDPNFPRKLSKYLLVDRYFSRSARVNPRKVNKPLKFGVKRLVMTSGRLVNSSSVC